LGILSNAQNADYILCTYWITGGGGWGLGSCVSAEVFSVLLDEGNSYSQVTIHNKRNSIVPGFPFQLPLDSWKIFRSIFWALSI